MMTFADKQRIVQDILKTLTISRDFPVSELAKKALAEFPDPDDVVDKTDTVTLNDFERVEQQRDELAARVHQLEKDVCWWAGEGQETRPELIEWRKLTESRDRTLEQTERMKTLANQIREESDPDAMREKRDELSAVIRRLREIGYNEDCLMCGVINQELRKAPR